MSAWDIYFQTFAHHTSNSISADAHEICFKIPPPQHIHWKVIKVGKHELFVYYFYYWIKKWEVSLSLSLHWWHGWGIWPTLQNKNLGSNFSWSFCDKWHPQSIHSHVSLELLNCNSPQCISLVLWLSMRQHTHNASAVSSFWFQKTFVFLLYTT